MQTKTSRASTNSHEVTNRRIRKTNYLKTLSRTMPVNGKCGTDEQKKYEDRLWENIKTRDELWVVDDSAVGGKVCEC